MVLPHQLFSRVSTNPAECFIDMDDRSRTVRFRNNRMLVNNLAVHIEIARCRTKIFLCNGSCLEVIRQFDIKC